MESRGYIADLEWLYGIKGITYRHPMYQTIGFTEYYIVSSDNTDTIYDSVRIYPEDWLENYFIPDKAEYTSNTLFRTDKATYETMLKYKKMKEEQEAYEKSRAEGPKLYEVRLQNAYTGKFDTTFTTEFFEDQIESLLEKIGTDYVFKLLSAAINFKFFSNIEFKPAKLKTE